MNAPASLLTEQDRLALRDAYGQLDRAMDRKFRNTHMALAGGAHIRAASPDKPDHMRRFTGYACVTGYAYPIYGGPGEGGWNETVERGAFAKTLASNCDVAFLLNHRGMTLARTKSGTLRLAEDTQGLAVDADLDSRNTDVANIALAMERGDLDEMSFAFFVIRERWLTADGDEVPWWDPEGIDRRILEVSMAKGDVSIVNYGANDATSASMRDRELFAELRSGQLDPRKLERFAQLAGARRLDPTPEPEPTPELRTDPAPEPDPVPQVPVRRAMSLSEALALEAAARRA